MICRFGEIPFRPLGDDNLPDFSNITKAPFVKYATKRQNVKHEKRERLLLNECIDVNRLYIL